MRGRWRRWRRWAVVGSCGYVNGGAAAGLGQILQDIVKAYSVTLHMPHCIPDTHAEILQIRLLGVVSLVTVALSLAQ